MPKKPLLGVQVHEKTMVQRDRYIKKRSELDLEYRELSREISELKERKISALKEGYENEKPSPDVKKLDAEIEALRKRKADLRDKKQALNLAIGDVEKVNLLNQYYSRQKTRKKLDREHTALCDEREKLHKDYEEKRADLTKRIQANDNQRHAIDEEDRKYIKEHGYRDHPQLFQSPEKKREESAKRVRKFKQRLFDSDFRSAILSVLRLHKGGESLPDKLRKTCEWWAEQASDRDMDIPTFHGLGFDEIVKLTHFEATRLSREKDISADIAKFDETFKREIGELFDKYRDPKLTEKVKAKIQEFKQKASEQGFGSWMPVYQGRHEPGIIQLCKKVSEEKEFQAVGPSGT